MTANNNHRRTTHPGTPAYIEYKSLKFLIVNKPSHATLPQFIKDLKKHDAKVVVRCCDPTYSTDTLTEEGVRVVDYPFDDGAAPPTEVVKQWLELVNETFHDESNSCIAVHCVAGLGRAPVLVAIALIESGMKYHMAVDLIRQKRRGAINQKQLEYLESYKASSKPAVCRLM